MKKMFKMAAKCLIMILIVAAFSGCGSKKEEESTDTTVVKVWIHKAEADDEGKVYRTLVDQFNDSNTKAADGSTLKIKLEYKGTSDTLSTAISSEILTGGLPDIIAVDASQYSAYQSEGVIVSIDEYITKQQRDEYVDSVIEQATIDGKLYGLSGMDAPGGLYYNKEIITTEVLEKAGLTDYGTISDPWSWRDVYNVLKVLKEEGKPYQIKLNLGFGGAEGCMYLYSSLVYSAGGTFNQNGKIIGALDSDNSINGLRSLEKILTKENGENYSYVGENSDAFAQGEVALQIFGSWDITTINKKYTDFKSKYDIMPMPVYEENGTKGTIATPCGSWGFAVTKDSKKVNDAATVIAYLTGKNAGQMFFEGIGTFPTNKALFTELSAFSEDGPMKSLADLLVNTAKPRPILSKYPKLASAYSNIIEYIETMVNESDYNLPTFVNDKARAADEGM